MILGLCSQTDLHTMVQQANERLAREGQAVPPPPAPDRRRRSGLTIEAAVTRRSGLTREAA